MRFLIAFTLLLAVGSSTYGHYVSPYVYSQGYPFYAPYTQYVQAYRVPAPIHPESEKMENDNAELTYSVPPQHIYSPYYYPIPSPSFHPSATQKAVKNPKMPLPSVASYAAPPVAAPSAAQYYYYAPSYAYAGNSQFHAQDEQGNLRFGYSNGHSAKYEHGNAYTGVNGGYQYVDANGVLQTVTYVADGHGFRTIDSRLPLEVQADEHHVKQVEDTPAVKAAKKVFKKAFEAAEKKATNHSEE